MIEQEQGVGSCISSKHSKPLHTHCPSHRLNLSVMKCCTIQEVSNMMQTADSISHFFSNSPKRQLALGFIVRFRGKAEEMKGMCGTQWVVWFLPTFCSLEAITIGCRLEHTDKLRCPDTDAGYATVFIHRGISACTESSSIHKRAQHEIVGVLRILKWFMPTKIWSL